LPLRLYADECVDARIVAGLRRRGVDMVTAADESMLGGADGDHLARAIHLGRIVVSADRDFLRLAQECVEAAASFPGLIFILPATRVGDAVRAITLVAEALSPDDLEGWIEWVP